MLVKTVISIGIAFGGRYKNVDLGKGGEADIEPCREMLAMCTCKQSLSFV